MGEQVEISFGSLDAVMKCLRLLAELPDFGADEAFVQSVSRRVELTAGAAVACRKVLARHRDRLPRKVAAVAMGEVEPTALEPVISDALADVLELLGVPELEAASPAAPKRSRGRPRKGAAPMTQTERTRRWREGRDIVHLEIPASLAERIRQLREAQGTTTAELLLAAMDALEQAKGRRGE